MKVDVFISYHSASSQEIAGAIKNRLESNGYSCWYSGKDMGGGDYASGIMQALTQCRVFLLILNQASSESAHVLNELEIVTNRMAKKEDVTIIPFKVAREDISPAAQYYINRHHWIDATKSTLDKHISELVEQLGEILDTEEDKREKEAAKKKERRIFWAKLLFCLVAAAGLVYGFRMLPADYEAEKMYYLIHLLLVSAPMLMLLFEKYERASRYSGDFAGYMIVASVVIFIAIYFNLRSWEAVMDAERILKVIKGISASDFTQEVIFYGGAYALLVFYPWHSLLMKTGGIKILWFLVCLLTGVWTAVISVLNARSAMAVEGNWAGVALCLWGVLAGVYIVYHNIAERRAMRNT